MLTLFAVLYGLQSSNLSNVERSVINRQELYTVVNHNLCGKFIVDKKTPYYRSKEKCSVSSKLKFMEPNAWDCLSRHEFY